MCGIAGVIRFDGAAVDPGLVAEMTAELGHRGPDGSGTWVSGPVGLGHRRLSIIDVAGSAQPMASTDGRLRVTFNGEILNYRELRRGLAYSWRTSGDTETILAAYERDGIESVDRLRGQFAFALWDDRQRHAWLVRDRMGILPLYYHRDARMLAFASEVKALLPALRGGPQVDPDGLAEYLLHRVVPAPRTLFAGIRKVPPGHRLRVGLDGDVDVEPYWRLPRDGGDLAVDDGTARREVSTALGAAVDEALVADVPVGALLSGGLDSSLIVALAARRQGPANLHTYSATFGDPRWDEGRYAAAVAETVGTRHHEVRVGAADFERLWHRLTWHRDGPMSEPADLAVYRLAEAARAEVKVLLSGEGSDELFAGYPKYAFSRLTAAAGVVPAPVRATVLGAVERRLLGRRARPRVAARALAQPSAADRAQAWFAAFTPAEVLRLLGRPGPRSHAEVWERARGDARARMQYLDCHAWLADNLLERGDRMCMAASVELRPPFLDHRLVELAFALPGRAKLRGRTGKWVLRELARDLLPDWVARRPKVGFRLPMDAWFRTGLREMANDLLLARGSFVTSVMDRQAVAALLDRHHRGAANEDVRIWTLLCLEVWHETFFRGGRPEGRPPTPCTAK
jgi:asparagine synthase (glutamine-hydrolysing)